MPLPLHTVAAKPTIDKVQVQALDSRSCSPYCSTDFYKRQDFCALGCPSNTVRMMNPTTIIKAVKELSLMTKTMTHIGKIWSLRLIKGERDLELWLLDIHVLTG